MTFLPCISYHDINFISSGVCLRIKVRCPCLIISDFICGSSMTFPQSTSLQNT
ncbi:hypothetical protein Hanom_Chr03g00236191 [Helianthus anomalus]